MVRCPKCGAEHPEGQACPHCAPRRDSSMDRVAHKTGEVIEKGVDVVEKAAKELEPAAKDLAKAGKKGLKKLRDTTLKVAKDLKE